MESREYKIMYEVEDNHFWYKGMRRITNVLINKYLPKNKNIMILDAGCGTGRNIIFLNKYGKVFGFDISKEALKFCKKRGFKNISIASVDKIPYKKNSFDLICCFDVLGQFEVKDINNAIKEFLRVLKHNGYLIIRVAAYDWLRGNHDSAVHTKLRFNKREIEFLLKKNNYKIIRSTYANTILFPFALIKRLLDKISSLDNSVSDVKQVNIFINSILKIPFKLESLLIKYFDLPFGLSLFVVAKKIN
jgi:ubiquinone/menaquinone biosynthesis C-methylase UbiE